MSPQAVYDELERGGDGLLVWLEAKKSCFQPLDDMVQAAMHGLLTRYPDFADEDAVETSGDPFVVALALVRDGVVVSNEKPKKSGGMTKIPDACAGFGVRCITLLEFLGEVT